MAYVKAYDNKITHDIHCVMKVNISEEIECSVDVQHFNIFSILNQLTVLIPGSHNTVKRNKTAEMYFERRVKIYASNFDLQICPVCQHFHVIGVS